MKVFVLSPNENWIVDRFYTEWCLDNNDITIGDPRLADVIWLMSDWCWTSVPYEILKKKKVLTSIHHIVPDKFGDVELEDFRKRDEITDAYHVPCKKTFLQVEEILKKIGSSKPIFTRPFWVNEVLWKPIQKFKARTFLKLDQDAFLVGSFQRDTEGKDLISPKLEKGPDRFCEVIEKMYDMGLKPVPLLAGWRRQYIMNRLSKAGISYIYNELPTHDLLRCMYASLDLYVVASRFEGGPQSIVECASMDVSVVSTDVGIASEILHENCIFNPDDFQTFLSAKMYAQMPESKDFALANVSQFFRKPSYVFFRNLLEGVK